MRLGGTAGVVALAIAVVALPAGAQDEPPGAGEAYEDAIDSEHAEVDRFQSWIGRQLETLEREIDELQAELEEAEPAARERIDEMIRNAEQLAGELREQARRAGAATADEWEGAKASALSGWHRVRAAYYAALAELRGDGKAEN